VVIDWSGPDEPENPFNWPTSRKWLATGLGLLATFSSIINGAIVTVAHFEIDADFNIDETVFPHYYWPMTSWGIGGALFSGSSAPDRGLWRAAEIFAHVLRLHMLLDSHWVFSQLRYAHSLPLL
jgi:hypothetical protein